MGGIDDPQTFNMNSSGGITTTMVGGMGFALDDMEITVKGDPTNPVATLMLGDPTKPLTTLVEGDPTKPVTTLMLGDPTKPLTTLIEGDRTKPVALSIEHIPRIELSAEIGMKPTRIHNPVYLNFCMSLFGLEILSLALCGESMTVIEPYHPHKTESCA
jgi:hypothetical protein